MLDELVGYKRKKEEHKLYIQFIQEVSYAIGLDVRELNKALMS